MAKVEIDEEEVRQLSGLRQTVSTLWANPQARKLIQQAQKIVDPKAKTPDLDQEAAVLEPVNALAKKFDEYIEKTEAEKAEERKNRKISELKAIQDNGFAELRRQKYTDEGLKKVQAVMDEKGLLDPLDAAKLLEASMPQQTPVTPGGSGAWNFTELPAEGADHLKKMIDTKGQNDLIAEKMAWEAINEIRGVSRR